MSCVADAILRTIPWNEQHAKPSDPVALFKWLKSKNRKPVQVTWNGEKLTKQQMEENVQAISNMKLEDATSGYYTSCFEPMFFLLCEIFKINIDHNFNGVNIKYCHKTSKITKCFSSSSSHMN